MIVTAKSIVLRRIYKMSNDIPTEQEVPVEEEFDGDDDIVDENIDDTSDDDETFPDPEEVVRVEESE